MSDECRIQLLREDDANWPQPDRVGRQELEVILDDQHISFTTTKLGSLTQVTQSKDPEGLRVFYYLVQVSAGEAQSSGPRQGSLKLCCCVPGGRLEPDGMLAIPLGAVTSAC